MVPKSTERCCVCGEPKKDGMGTWMIDHPHWAHTRCVDWEARSFPYEWRLKRLRSIAHALTRVYGRAVWAGRYILETRRLWPRDARERLAQIDEREAVVQDELRRLREKIDGR